VGAVLTGCGGSSGGGVTHQAFHRALKAAACVRATASPTSPNPSSSTEASSSRSSPGVNPTTPAVQTAAKKCGYQDELRAEETRSRIAFVRCMRTHGVTNFPYPTADGGVSVEMVRAEDINPQSSPVVRVVSERLPPWLRPPTTR